MNIKSGCKNIRVPSGTMYRAMQEFRQCVSSRVDKVRTSAVAASAPFRAYCSWPSPQKASPPPASDPADRHKRRPPSLIIVSCSTSVFPCTFFHFGSIGSWPVHQSRSASPCFNENSRRRTKGCLYPRKRKQTLSLVQFGRCRIAVFVSWGSAFA